MSTYDASQIDWLRPPQVEGIQGNWTSRWLLVTGDHLDELDIPWTEAHSDILGVILTEMGDHEILLEMNSVTHPLDPEGYLAVDAVLRLIHERMDIQTINGSPRIQWRTFRDWNKIE